MAWRQTVDKPLSEPPAQFTIVDPSGIKLHYNYIVWNKFVYLIKTRQ